MWFQSQHHWSHYHWVCGMMNIHIYILVQFDAWETLPLLFMLSAKFNGVSRAGMAQSVEHLPGLTLWCNSIISDKSQGCVKRTPLPSANMATQSGFKTQRRRHQKSKTKILKISLMWELICDGSTLTHVDNLFWYGMILEQYYTNQFYTVLHEACFPTNCFSSERRKMDNLLCKHTLTLYLK